jgi:PAS domain-containing protein
MTTAALARGEMARGGTSAGVVAAARDHSRERREACETLRLLETSTVGAFVLACGATGVFWFLRILPLEIGTAARVAFAYAVLYLLAGRAAEALAPTAALRATTVLLRAVSIAVLAAVWHLLGGVHNPMLLLVFAIPVVAAAVAAGPAYAALEALGSVLAVAAVSVMESAELRWYLFQFGVPSALVPSLSPVTGATELLPDLVAQPSYVIVVLGMFAAIQTGGALVAGDIAHVLRRRRARQEFADTAVSAVTHSFQAALTQTPLPTAVVHADTAEVLLTSESFRQGVLRHGEDLTGRSLFELVSFADPARVRELVRDGGEVLLCPCAVGPEQRVVHLRSFAFTHGPDRLACVTLEERSELTYLRAATEAMGDAVLIIGEDRRVRYANRAAGELLGELHYGMEEALAAQALNGSGHLFEPGWEGERRVQLGGRELRVSQSTVALRSGAEVLRMITLHRVTSSRPS